MVIRGGLLHLLFRSNRLQQAVAVPDSGTHKNVATFTCNRFQTQRGTYAVEFALVFPLFFLIVYATLTYGLIFTAQQSLNYAAESGARAALGWPDSSARALAAQAQTASGSPDASENQKNLSARAWAALSTVQNLSGWIESLDKAWRPGSSEHLAIAVCNGDGANLASSGTATGSGASSALSLCASVKSSQGSSQIGVVLRYPYADAPLVPLLGGSLMGFAVPNALTAVSQVNLNIAYGAPNGG